MSTPVEGKPGVRLVWWCVEHDLEAVWEIGEDRYCDITSSPCRVHRLELRQHGYEKIEWGEQ